MKEIQNIIREWKLRGGQPLALATLVRAQGSSYRRPGARMLVCPDGVTVGSLSGGCLEEEVSRRALEVIRSRRPTLMSFDTRLRFGCHGTIQIFIELVRESFLANVANHLEERRGCRAVTVFIGGDDELGTRVVVPADRPPPGAFIHDIEPPIQLLLFGKGRDSIPLRSFSELLGWQVIDVDQASELPERADPWMAAVVKSHNYGRDFAALQSLLPLGLRYVGLVGPRKRRDQLLGVLLGDGIAVDSELFAPAGLDLGAETPEEIALAIVAEIQSVFAKGSAKSLRDRKAPIHTFNLVPTPIGGFMQMPTHIEEWEMSAP